MASNERRKLIKTGLAMSAGGVAGCAVPGGARQGSDGRAVVRSDVIEGPLGGVLDLRVKILQAP